MMKIALFFFFAACVFVPSESCSKELREKCSTIHAIAREFPETENQLDEFCENGLKFFECVSNTDYECEDPESEFPSFVEEFHPVLKHICKKDTLLNEALVKSLPCLKKTATAPAEVSCIRLDFEDIDPEELINMLTEEEASELATNEDDRAECIPSTLPRSHIKSITKVEQTKLWQIYWETESRGRVTYGFFPEINNQRLVSCKLLKQLYTGHGSFPRNNLLHISCFPALVGIKCDNIARDVLVEIAQQFRTPFEPCNLAIREQLPAIVEAMQLALSKELEAENALKKRK